MAVVLDQLFKEGKHVLLLHEPSNYFIFEGEKLTDKISVRNATLISGFTTTLAEYEPDEPCDHGVDKLILIVDSYPCSVQVEDEMLVIDEGHVEFCAEKEEQ